MHRATGLSGYLDGTQPESQEQHLADWVEARRRERRFTLTPKTENLEEIEMAKIEGIMDGIGICTAVLAGIGIIALLIYHLNWWVVPALVSAIFLGWIIRHKGGF